MYKRKPYAHYAQHTQIAQYIQTRAYHGPPNQGTFPPHALNSGCCNRRCCRCREDGGRFYHAQGPLGLIARRMGNKNGNRLPLTREKKHEGIIQAQAYKVQEPAYYERDMNKITMENILVQEGRAGVNSIVVDKKIITEIKNEVEGIGQRRVDEALRAGRRYGSIVAPPEYSDTWTKV